MSILEHDALVYRNGEGGITLISLIVHGDPKPQGSKRHVGGGVMVEQVKGARPWREQLVREIKALEVETILGPVNVEATFYFQRPKHHFGTGRNAGLLKAHAPDYQTSYPDIDKLCRNLLDAMTIGALLRDDGQVCVLVAEKRYAPTPGVHVKLRPL